MEPTTGDRRGAGAFEGDLEGVYERSLALLKQPPKSALGALLLVGSLAAFLLVQRGVESSWQTIGALVATLAFHELGHFVAMRAFGYRDVKMFFIPFLGAAVSGRRVGVAVWKEGVVLLAGPAPGIIVGAILAATIRNEGSAWLRLLASTLLILNAFNLLPLALLDGGKVLQLTVFARHIAAEVVFLALAGAGLVVWSIRSGQQALLYVAIFTVMGLPARFRRLRAAGALRARGLEVPADARDLDGDVAREVFVAARQAAAKEHQSNPAVIAAGMGDLVELTNRNLPTAAQSLALIGTLGLSLGVAAAGYTLLTAPSWRDFADSRAGFSISLPARPQLRESDQTSAPAPFRMLVVSASAASVGCRVEALRSDAAAPWDLRRSAEMARDAYDATGAVSPLESTRLAGRDAFEFRLTGRPTPDLHHRVVIVADDDHLFRVVGIWSGDDGSVARRCIESFRLIR